MKDIITINYIDFFMFDFSGKPALKRKSLAKLIET